MSELLGMNFTQSKENLEKVQTAIVALINTGKFIESGLDVYDLATIESEIGTDLQTDPARQMEARFWQAQQDALDLLVYSYHEVTREPNPTFAVRVNSGSFEYTAQAAWTELLGATPATIAITGGIKWFIGYSSGSGVYSGTILDDGAISFDMPSWSGAYSYMGYQLTVNNEAGFDVSYTCGSANDTVVAGQASDIRWIQSSTGDISPGGIDSIPLAFSTGEPGTVPYTGLSGSTNTTIQLSKLRGVFDMSSELTDQQP